MAPPKVFQSGDAVEFRVERRGRVAEWVPAQVSIERGQRGFGVSPNLGLPCSVLFSPGIHARRYSIEGGRWRERHNNISRCVVRWSDDVVASLCANGRDETYSLPTPWRGAVASRGGYLPLATFQGWGSNANTNYSFCCRPKNQARLFCSHSAMGRSIHSSGGLDLQYFRQCCYSHSLSQHVLACFQLVHYLRNRLSRKTKTAPTRCGSGPRRFPAEVPT